MQMTEQERIHRVSVMIDCYEWVFSDPARLMDWKKKPAITLSTSMVAELCGLPENVVVAAVENLKADGKATDA